MASDITRQPWLLDASTFAAEFPTGVITTQGVAMGVMVWTSATAAAGDQVIVQHNDGTTFWNGKDIWHSQSATGADFSDDFKAPVEFQAHGIKISTFSSGLLEIYFR